MEPSGGETILKEPGEFPYVYTCPSCRTAVLGIGGVIVDCVQCGSRMIATKREPEPKNSEPDHA
jgi:DNA-directed RNA polymerase subunit RPC12/RpoP